MNLDEQKGRRYQCIREQKLKQKCLEEFMNYTGLGRGSAMKLGKEIGCVMKVGKRALYDTRKADLYFDSLTGVK